MKKKLLVFLQEGYYQKKLNRVLEKFTNFEVTVISRTPILSSRYVEKNYSTKSVFKIIFLIQKLRKTKFDVFLAANVDDFFFHLMHKFANFQEFITFDEGQRSLVPYDFYFNKKFADSGQSKIKLLNFLFQFPLPYGKYFDESSTHYTFYDKNFFHHALKDHKNLVLLEENKDKRQIEKIFIGISSHWYTNFKGTSIEKGGDTYNKKILEAAKRINDLNPDLYLMHPREENELVMLLNDNIIVNKSPYGGNEYLINALHSSNQVKVYTERTGIIFDLDQDIDIIFVNIFDRFDEKIFQEFIDRFDNVRKNQNPNHKSSKRISYAIKK